MLFFSKPKKSLADLIPDGYVDIHSHLMPGIDDGAKDAEDTRQLLTELKGYGFSEFITTPHVLPGVWDNTREGIILTEKETAPLFKEAAIPFKAAAEYMLDEVFNELIRNEKLLTLKDNYVLVEMSYINAPIQLYDILFELQVAGYKPILAHPERYLFYHQNYDEYTKLKKAGCELQLNLLSVTGYYGKAVAQVAKKLLDDNLITFTGSDVHHTRHTASFKNKVLLSDHTKLEAVLNNNALFKI